MVSLPPRVALVRFLTGFSQILLQESAWAGLLFLLAIACGGWPMLAGALLGNLCSSQAARLLGLASTAQRERGWYGYNGALVGLALTLYFPPSVLLLLVLALACALTAPLLALWERYCSWPALTTPFVLLTWAVLLLAGAGGWPTQAPPPAPAPAPAAGALVAVLRGVGQIVFQDHWLAGVLLLLGTALVSLRAAAWALAGSALGAALALAWGLPAAWVAAGLYGFNPALTALALTLQQPHRPSTVLLGALLAFGLHAGLLELGWTPLTAPFVLAYWLTTALARRQSA